MNTRIQKTLHQWFPEAFSNLGIPESDSYSEYDTLRHFALFTMQLIRDDGSRKREPFKIINLLYSKGTLYERNAIENEFFTPLASGENAGSLKEILELMPETLKSVFIKTIVEN